MIGSQIVGVEKDPNGVHPYVFDAVRIAKNMAFPPRISSLRTMSKMFKDTYPYYRDVPNDMLNGVFSQGEGITHREKGVNFYGDRIKFRILGEVWVEKPKTLSEVTKIKIVDEGFELFGIKKPVVRKKFKPEVHDATNLNELKKEDPILYHLMVNQAYTQYGPKRFWKLYDTIKYFEEHPNLTRRELEKMGVRSNDVWELIADYQPALSVWIKSGNKPKDAKDYFFSKNQLRKKMKPERRMPGVITSQDVDSGSLQGQSFEAEVYAASSSNKFQFFS